MDDDLLFTKDGSIGKLAHVRMLPDLASLNSHLLVIRPLNKLYINRFLFYYLQSSCFDIYLEHVKQGSTFYGISQEAFCDFELLLPSLEEQEKIAGFLDDKTNEIEHSIENLQKLVYSFDEKRSAYIKQAVTKGLDTEVVMVESGVEWLGQIPSHWTHKRMRFLCEITTGGRDTQDAEDEGEFHFLCDHPILKKSNLFFRWRGSFDFR